MWMIPSVACVCSQEKHLPATTKGTPMPDGICGSAIPTPDGTLFSCPLTKIVSRAWMWKRNCSPAWQWMPSTDWPGDGEPEGARFEPVSSGGTSGPDGPRGGGETSCPSVESGAVWEPELFFPRRSPRCAARRGILTCRPLHVPVEASDPPTRHAAAASTSCRSACGLRVAARSGATRSRDRGGARPSAVPPPRSRRARRSHPAASRRRPSRPPRPRPPRGSPRAARRRDPPPRARAG